MKNEQNQEPDKLQLYWRRELERAHKHFSEKFWPTADKLIKLYKNQSTSTSTKRRFAMLWANTEILKPSIYARPPVPQVSRRYKDKDPIGRTAAELLERASSYEFERMNLDYTLRCVRDDLLLPGRGAAWIRYEADIDEMTQQVSGERVVCDYIHFKQFLHEPVRNWTEVTWVAKISYMTDKEGQARFGEAWKGVELDHKSEAESGENPQLTRSQTAKATVYEIWDKKSKKTIFIAKSAMQPLAVEDPLLKFDEFFPCPRPVYTTLTNDNMIPTPDYKYYQDQADEIDQLTDRIASLTDSLKMVAFYPAGAEGDISTAIERALKPGVENVAIPIKSWAAFGERGGGNQIVYLPMKEVSEVIKSCVELRNQLIQDTYQITGISDILRGATDSGETATAQSIKAQWGSIRIQDRQQEMARFSRDLTRLTCEIIAEQFAPETLMDMANMKLPPQPQPPPPMQPTGDPQQDQMMQQQMQQAEQAMQQWQQQAQQMQEVFALLKDERLRGFRIDIETDSTIQPDEDAEKQRRVEFVSSIGELLQNAVPLLMQAPELADLVAETMNFTARGFRAGRQLEDAIEQGMNSVKERLTQQVQQQPSDPNQPAMQKAQADLEHTKAKNAIELDHMRTKADIETQIAQQRNQTELQLKQKAGQADVDIMSMRAQTGLKSEKQRLREEIINEEREAFMGQEGEAPNALASVIQEAFAGIMQVVAQSNQAVVDSNNSMLKVLASPKVITAPDGRTYTAQTRVLN
jgi:hypothetical protein